jgi:hypothetical protein
VRLYASAEPGIGTHGESPRLDPTSIEQAQMRSSGICVAMCCCRLNLSVTDTLFDFDQITVHRQQLAKRRGFGHGRRCHAARRFPRIKSCLARPGFCNRVFAISRIRVRRVALTSEWQSSADLKLATRKHPRREPRRRSDQTGDCNVIKNGQSKPLRVLTSRGVTYSRRHLSAGQAPGF